jgi:hypothetical protein
MLHFDHAPIHNTEEVQGHLTNLGFTRMEHPPYGPDLASCDFFLFDAMKESFSGQRFDSVEEIFLAVEALLRWLSVDFLQASFLEWERRLRYAEKAAENMLSERYQILFLVLR